MLPSHQLVFLVGVGPLGVSQAKDVKPKHLENDHWHSEETASSWIIFGRFGDALLGKYQVYVKKKQRWLEDTKPQRAGRSKARCWRCDKATLRFGTNSANWFNFVCICFRCSLVFLVLNCIFFLWTITVSFFRRQLAEMTSACYVLTPPTRKGEIEWSASHQQNHTLRA